MTNICGYSAGEKAVVFKHYLDPGLNTFTLPYRSYVVHVEWQIRCMLSPDVSLNHLDYHYVLCLWTVQPVESTASDTRTFRVVMTGEEFDVGRSTHRLTHLGSATSRAGIVAHVFEVVS